MTQELKQLKYITLATVRVEGTLGSWTRTDFLNWADFQDQE